MRGACLRVSYDFADKKRGYKSVMRKLGVVGSGHNLKLVCVCVCVCVCVVGMFFMGNWS